MQRAASDTSATQGGKYCGHETPVNGGGDEAMDCGTKCRKWGCLGWLGNTQGHGQGHTCSIERMVFLLNFNRNYADILYRFRDRPIASYFV